MLVSEHARYKSMAGSRMVTVQFCHAAMKNYLVTSMQGEVATRMSAALETHALHTLAGLVRLGYEDSVLGARVAKHCEATPLFFVVVVLFVSWPRMNTPL